MHFDHVLDVHYTVILGVPILPVPTLIELEIFLLLAMAKVKSVKRF